MPRPSPLLFCTIANNNGEPNPLSAQIIPALHKHILTIGELRRRGSAAFVLSPPDTGRPRWIAPGSIVVTLFDVPYGCGVNQWSLRPSAYRDNPGWVRELSTSSSVAIGRECVKFPLRIEDAVRQITRMFSQIQNADTQGSEYPWGTPSAKYQRTQRLPAPHFRRAPAQMHSTH